LVNNDKLDIFKQIKIDGDLNFGTKLLEILSKLNFDGVYSKVSPLNGAILHKVEIIFSAIKNHFVRMQINMVKSLSEYFVYETRDIINGFKIDDFCDNVDDLKSRTDILTKKIEKLRNEKQ
jgi:ubiquinone biosynthesis protein UbiJ